MGIVINRPTDIALVEMLHQLDLEAVIDSDARVYAGGPVQVDRGFILHDGDKCWESTLELSSGVKLTTSKDILEAIAEGHGPENYLVALGYAGWSDGQLEDELGQNTWLSCPASDEILFAAGNEQKLEQAMNSLGIKADQLVGDIGHA